MCDVTNIPRAAFGGAVLVLAGLAPVTAAQVKEDWRSFEFTARMGLDAQDNLFVNGTSQDPDIVATKYDPQGNLIWNQSFGDPSVVEHAHWLAVDSAGNVIVTGHKHGATGGLITVKFSADGAVLWSDVRSVDSGEAYRVELDAADNVYVLGITFDARDSFDFFTVKYDPGGTLLWQRQKTVAAGSNDGPSALAVSPGGRVAVAGRVGSNDFGTVVYDTDGAELFTAAYLDGKGGASDVVIGPDGSVFVCGSAVGNAAVVLRYAPQGNLMWERRVNAPAGWFGRFHRMALDSMGNIIAVGKDTAPNSSFMDWFVVKMDPQGTVLWSAQHGNLETFDETALAVATGPQDEVYVAGSAGAPDCNGGRGVGTVVIRYDSQGQVEWIHEAACSAGTPTTVALDSSGELAVDGGSGGAALMRLLQQDWMTLGFALSGTQGDPALEVDGHLESSAVVSLRLDKALPWTRGWHVVGTSRVDIPLAGGTLVPAWELMVPFRADSAGQTSASISLPPSLAGPLHLYVQSWMLDGGAIEGFAASNAVTKALR